MPDRLTGEHYSRDEIAEYFADALDPARASLLEEHFATCEECVEEARLIQVFGFYWHRWTAHAIRDANRAAVLVRALKTAQASPDYSAWRDRLHAWQERWEARAAGAVRVLLTASEQGSRVLTEGVASLIGPEAWEFRPQLAPGELLVRGSEDEQVATVATASVRDSHVRVEVIATAGQLIVSIDRVAHAQLPLVLVTELNADSEPQLGVWEQNDDGTGSIARFYLPPGEYVVAFGPSDS